MQALEICTTHMIIYPMSPTKDIKLWPSVIPLTWVNNEWFNESISGEKAVGENAFSGRKYEYMFPT